MTETGRECRAEVQERTGRFFEKKLGKKLSTDEVYPSTVIMVYMIPQGNFLLTMCGFNRLCSGLRVQFLTVLEGAMPIYAYQIIRNSFIRLIGTTNPIRRSRGEYLDFVT